jgi:hypothetical protein
MTAATRAIRIGGGDVGRTCLLLGVAARGRRDYLPFP